MTARAIDGILFDKDGTLFDFRRSWGAWSDRFLRHVARDEAHAAEMGRAIGYDLSDGSFAPDSPVIATTAEVIGTHLMPHLPDLTLAEILSRIDAMAAEAPMAEAVPLIPVLSALKGRGLRLGLATNDSEVPARTHLDRHGVRHLFDFVSGYDSGHGAKPGPGMCLAFAKSQSLDPRRVVMVGDSRHDLEAGRAAGMRTVAVLTGIATAGDLAPLADAVLPDIGALGDWLDAQPAG